MAGKNKYLGVFVNL